MNKCFSIFTYCVVQCNGLSKSLFSFKLKTFVEHSFSGGR